MRPALSRSAGDSTSTPIRCHCVLRGGEAAAGVHSIAGPIAGPVARLAFPRQPVQSAAPLPHLGQHQAGVPQAVQSGLRIQAFIGPPGGKSETAPEMLID